MYYAAFFFFCEVDSVIPGGFSLGSCLISQDYGTPVRIPLKRIGMLDQVVILAGYSRPFPLKCLHGWSSFRWLKQLLRWMVEQLVKPMIDSRLLLNAITLTFSCMLIYLFFCPIHLSTQCNNATKIGASNRSCTAAS